MSHVHKEPSTPEERKQMLADAKEELRVAEMLLTPIRNRIKALKDGCEHNMVCDSCKTAEPKCPKWEWSHMGAECTICGLGKSWEDHLGWFCPDSPDHVCHYRSEVDYEALKTCHESEREAIQQKRFVTLLNKERHYLPASHNLRHESDDWCIFCGQPEERK